MRAVIDVLVCICLLMVLFINLTSLPERSREVHGPLIKHGVEE